MDSEISLDWIISELNQMKVVSEVVTRARIFNRKLLAVTEHEVTAGVLSFVKFFTLVVGLRFTSELIDERHCMPPVDINERRRQEMIPRGTLPTDVDEVIERLKAYWQSRFPLLKKQIDTKKMPAETDAGKWLDIIINSKHDLTVDRAFLRYRVTNDIPPVTIEELCGAGSVELVSSELEKIVRYHEYGLSGELEEQAKQTLPLTYDLDELSSRWGTNEKNIVAVCNKNPKLWAYINLAKEIRLENFHHKVIALETRKKISSGEVDADYKYPYCGFARLAKQGASNNSGITFRYFHANKTVDAERGTLTFLWVEPPLCNRVLGIYSQYINADKSFSPTLYFMQDEIHSFEETDQFQQIFPNNKVYPRQVLKQTDRAKSARKNGKKSGAIRKETADQIWVREKPAILELAKGLAGKTANYIAVIAVRKKLTRRSRSLIAKYIRNDTDLSVYIK